MFPDCAATSLNVWHVNEWKDNIGFNALLYWMHLDSKPQNELLIYQAGPLSFLSEILGVMFSYMQMLVNI